MRRGRNAVRLLGWAALGLVAAGCGEPASPRLGEGEPGGNGPRALLTAPLLPTVTPALAAVLAATLPTQRLLVIVQFDDHAVSGATIAQRVMALGAGARALRRLPFVGMLGTPAQVLAAAALPGVVRLSPNRQLQYFGAAPAGTAAPWRRGAWLEQSVPTIKADQARDSFNVDGHGIGVVILDSGIDGLYASDVQYPGRTVQNLKVIVNQQDVMCVTGLPCNVGLYQENLPVSETSVGHGTHVAGIAGGDGTASNGLYTGVAPGANLIGIGTGDVLFIFWTLAGFDYILANQARYNIKVVNNSWGTTGAFDPNDPVNVATKRLADAGITVVFAAGNDGPDQNTLNPYSVAPWVIGVAAACSETDFTAQEEDCSGDMLADFSSRGIPGNPQTPTVTAPGVRVVSARASTGLVLTGLDAPSDLGVAGGCGMRQEFIASYTCASGTSMATPHVTGVVALMQERAGGHLTPDQIKAILVQTAVPMVGHAPFEVGAGMVNALEAVRRSQ